MLAEYHISVRGGNQPGKYSFTCEPAELRDSLLSVAGQMGTRKESSTKPIYHGIQGMVVIDIERYNPGVASKPEAHSKPGDLTHLL